MKGLMLHKGFNSSIGFKLLKGFNFGKGLDNTYGNIPSSDIIPPVVTAFEIPATSDSLTIPITTFTATDNVAVTKYKITESTTPPLPGDLWWNAPPPATFTVAKTGNVTLYAWAKDAAGNVSNSLSDSVNISLKNEYLIVSLGITYIRKGIRNSIFVVDKTLTEIGFSGTENTDWENIKGIIL